jgi:hypothetical protein
MCFSAFNLIIALPLILYHAYHYFLHLLSTNHKCTQPCYFLLLYKPAAQKMKKMGSFDEEIYASDYPRSIICGVMVSFRCYIFESVRFSLL